jgi:hypothetical protein
VASLTCCDSPRIVLLLFTRFQVLLTDCRPTGVIPSTTAQWPGLACVLVRLRVDGMATTRTTSNMASHNSQHFYRNIPY